jgi:hypothetical protein
MNMAKKSQYIPGGHLSKRSSVGHGVTPKNPTLPRVSLDDAYRHPKPAAGKRSGPSKPVKLKRP